MSVLPHRDSLRPAEQRRTVRRRILMGGKLFIGAFSPTIIDGLATDVTDEGARFELPAPTLVPELFKVQLGTGEIRRARRCWMRGSVIGIEFIQG